MAINWEKNILGFVPKEDWVDIPFNPQRQGDPVDGLFGDLKTDNLAAKWLMSSIKSMIRAAVFIML